MADGARLKVAVLGPGGVGGFLAAMLARAGNDVVVVERTPSDGKLRLESARYGAFDVAVRSAPQLAGPVDAVLVTVKATQLDEAIERVPGEVIADAIVVPFLNGLDHVERLRRDYPPASVVAGTIRIEAAKVSTGLIRHTSPFAAIELAPSAENRDRVDRLAAALSAAGLNVKQRDDERAVLWDKFAVLEPMALLTTHAGQYVALTRALQLRRTAPADAQELAVLRARRHLERDGPLGRLHVDARAERRLRVGDRDVDHEVVAAAVVDGRGRHAGDDVEVTRRIVDELARRG